MRTLENGKSNWYTQICKQNLIWGLKALCVVLKMKKQIVVGGKSSD